MLPAEQSHRIHVAFCDHRLVAIAGLFLLITLAHHLDLSGPVDCHVDRQVDLGDAPGTSQRRRQAADLGGAGIGP